MNEENEGQGFLAIDGPFMRTMELVLNLMLLNMVTVICCIPVITAGAAFTAMNHQLYKMAENKEGYVIRGFFKDFKANFGLATKTWLIMLVIGIALGVDLYIFSEGVSFPAAYKWVVMALAAAYLFGMSYLFPILARYETTPKLAIKNAFAMATYGFVKTILMTVLMAGPWVAAVFVPNMILLDLLFGFSLPAFINVFLYKKTFRVFEGKQDGQEKTADAGEGDSREEEEGERTGTDRETSQSLEGTPK